jgi:hypothetical protein
MPILHIPKSLPKPTLEEARASDQIVEYESAGITYSYTPRISWIDGHEWANPRTIEERTESTDTSKTTKSWLLAQCLWWDLWKPGLKCPRSVTKADLSATLYNRIMSGGVRCSSVVWEMEADMLADAVSPSRRRLARAEDCLDGEVWV